MSGNDKRRSSAPALSPPPSNAHSCRRPSCCPGWLSARSSPASAGSPASCLLLSCPLQWSCSSSSCCCWLRVGSGCAAQPALSLRAPALPRGRAAPRLAVRRVRHAVGRTPQAVHQHARLRHVGVGLHVRVGQACGELRLRQQRWTRWRPCLAGICCSGRRRRAALTCCYCAWLSRLAGKPRQLFTAITAGLYSGWRAVGCRVPLLRRIGCLGHKAQLQATRRCCG